VRKITLLVLILASRQALLKKKFRAEIILSSLLIEHGDEGDDKLLIVDEELSDLDEELMKKNTSEY
jgi:hypothetical protein